MRCQSIVHHTGFQSTRSTRNPAEQSLDRFLAGGVERVENIFRTITPRESSIHQRETTPGRLIASCC